MAAVTLEGITLSYGAQTVLDGVSATLAKGDRVALAGPNGSGKSTLLRVAAGRLAPDAGSVRMQRGARVCYLPQSGSGEDAAVSGRTVVQELERAFADLHAAAARAADLEARMAGGDDGEPVLAAYGEIVERLERGGYHERDREIGAVMHGLGFDQADRDRPVGELSGGWEMRVALGRVLLSRADLLLLDEPTNYLDLPAREWLEGYLARGAGGFMLVAHDREFLDRCCRTVLEIRDGRLRSWTGGYTDFERARAEQDHADAKAYELQQEEIARIEAFIRRFRATASKARLVQSRIRYLERLPRLSRPAQAPAITLSLPEPPRSGKVPLTCAGLGKRYGDLQVFANVDLEVERNDRLAVVGRNGAGKSTLMRALAGVEEPSAGSIRRSAGLRQAYFAQDQERRLEPGLTVLETVQAAAAAGRQQQVRDLLGAFLFTADDVDKPVGVLSGGERVRVALARLLLQPINLLLLDEPTNHLDIISTEALARALEQYRGTLIVVSHDRAFLRRLVTGVLEVDRGGARLYPGDFSYYEWKRTNRESTGRESAGRDRTGRAGGATARPVPGPPARGGRRRAGGRRSGTRGDAGSPAEREERVLAELQELEEQRMKIEADLAREETWRDGAAMRALKRSLARNRQRERELTGSPAE